MRGLQLLALVVLLSARANARAHLQPFEHKHQPDHTNHHHVKHLVLDLNPLDQTHQERYPDHNNRSENRTHSSDHKERTDSHARQENHHTHRESHTWRDNHPTARANIVPEDTQRHVKASGDIHSPSHYHGSSQVHRTSEVSDTSLYNNGEPNSKTKVILQYVNHIEDLKNPSHHNNYDGRDLRSHDNSSPSETSKRAKTDQSPWEDEKLTSEARVHLNVVSNQPSKDNNPYISRAVVVNGQIPDHHEFVDLSHPIKVNHPDDRKHPNNRSPSEDVNFTSEVQILKSKAPISAKAGQDLTLTTEDENLTLLDENSTYQDEDLTDEDEDLTDEDEDLTDEDATYEDRNATSEEERATYEERNLTSEDERATYEERNLTSENDRATYEERNLTSEDERATYEERNLTSEDERATYEDRNFTSEDEKATYEERNLTSENERATYEERNLTSEDEKATYEERNLNSGKHRPRAHHTHGDKHRKTKHSHSSHRQAPKKTKQRKHFYSSSRVSPEFAKQLSQILRPFFHVQETSDERPFDLTRERLVHNGNRVEIFPLHPHPVSEDSKAPLALILGGPKRDKGRRKYFYNKKHKHGHVKASIEILDNESDESPGNDTQSDRIDISSSQIRSEVGNIDGGIVNFNDEGVNRIVELNYVAENDPVVALLSDIQSNTVFEPGNNQGILQVDNNDGESLIDDGFINASMENVFETNRNDFLTKESNSHRYSSLDSSISGYSGTLSSSSSDSSDLSNVSVYPSAYTLSGEKIEVETKSEDEKESDISSGFIKEDTYGDNESHNDKYILTSENQVADESVIDQNYYLTSVNNGRNDVGGIKEQLYNYVLVNNGENKKDVLDAVDEFTSVNEFNSDYTINDSSKNVENLNGHDTKLNEQFSREKISNEELTRENYKNHSLIIKNTNNSSAKVTKDRKNAVSDLTEDNSDEIELKVENDDNEHKKYVLQFRLLDDKKSDHVRVECTDGLRNLLEKHQGIQKSYNLSFLFQK